MGRTYEEVLAAMEELANINSMRIPKDPILGCRPNLKKLPEKEREVFFHFKFILLKLKS